MVVVTSAVANQSVTVKPTGLGKDNSTEDETSPYKEQWSMEHIRAFDAHDIVTGKGTTIAVIDTGVDHTHPDLKSQLDRDRSRLFRNGTIAAGVDTINLSTKLESVERFVATDVNWHGSHVAGIATAPRNESGIVGVAPDAKLVSLRPFFLEKANDYRLSGNSVDLLIAIDYAAKIGVDVANISLVVTGRNPGSVARRRMFAAFNRVIQYAIEQGTTVVTAMGNQGLNMNEYPGYVLPASNPGTISVAAVDETDTRRDDSNFGDSTTTVAAPGEQILSTVPEELSPQRYSYTSQTSVAAPHVAGLACLVRELNPDIHPRKITQAIQKGAVPLTGDGTTGLGAGRIDARTTIDYLNQ
ncbi:S8 family peptidase [Halostagnicola kamekurae]|nr:S8 family serine peptidase [Halostagnicola kamekurae]